MSFIEQAQFLRRLKGVNSLLTLTLSEATDAANSVLSAKDHVSKISCSASLSSSIMDAELICVKLFDLIGISDVM